MPKKQSQIGVYIDGEKISHAALDALVREIVNTFDDTLKEEYDEGFHEGYGEGCSDTEDEHKS